MPNGFAVVYRWRIQEGREAEFEAAWRRVTLAIRERCGSFGSRLHRVSDGTYVAYARWPSEASWKSCFAGDPPDAEGLRAMMDVVVERDPVLRMEISDDLLEEPEADDSTEPSPPDRGS